MRLTNAAFRILGAISLLISTGAGFALGAIVLSSKWVALSLISTVRYNEKMAYQLKIITFILLNIFVIFNIALAQDANIPQEIINPYQQQLNNAENNYPDYQQEPSSADTINVPSQQEPSPVIQLAPGVGSQEKPAPIQENPSTPAVSSEPSPVPQQTIDTVSTGRLGLYSYASYILYAAAIILITLFFAWWHWWRKFFKPKKKPELPAEAEKIVCPTCGGSGKITKKRKITAPCGHCKKTGIDICHHCSGTGRDGLGYGVPLEDIENYPKCLYCRGKGVPKMPIRCCMCKGKREEEFEESYEVPCPTCKGSGWIRNW